MKKSNEILILGTAFLMSVAVVAVVFFMLGQKKMSRMYGHFSQKEDEIRQEDFTNPYSWFLDDEKAEFIVSTCNDFGVDPNLAVAILNKENPGLKCDFVSKPNGNGSIDIGLWQLNDRSLYSKGGFVDLWWNEKLFGIEFNPTDWKHNTYIAVQLLNDLQKTFGKSNIWFIVAAYNCGCPRAYREYMDRTLSIIPDSTRFDYVPSVINTYNEIKNCPSIRH